MRTLICGSIAYDTIMVFGDYFKNHILPDQIHILNVAFLVPEMRREFGGTAGNIAYNLRLLGEDPLIMATVGHDFAPYAERLARLRLADRPARPSLVGRSGARALPIGQHPSALPHPRRSSLIDVFDRVFASTCFTITAQYSECVPSADGSDPDTTTEPGGT